MMITAACMTPAQSEEAVPEHGSSPGFRCEAGKAQALVGQSASGELGARASALTGARTIRWVQPGQMVTMDYRTDRLNIELDGRNRVTGIKCG
jgi:hypothetical protein